MLPSLLPSGDADQKETKRRRAEVRAGVAERRDRMETEEGDRLGGRWNWRKKGGMEKEGTRERNREE